MLVSPVELAESSANHPQSTNRASVAERMHSIVSSSHTVEVANQALGKSPAENENEDSLIKSPESRDFNLIYQNMPHYA